MLSDKLKQLSRRDLLRVTRQYGITSTLLAAGSMTGLVSAARLAEAANSTYEKRFKTEPKVTLKFGAAGFNERNLLIERAGCLTFAADLEERTDGAIRVEFIGSNQICGQLDCVKKTQQGIVDIFAASTQNSAGGAPYLNVLDYAYMFPSRAAPRSTTSSITPAARRCCASRCASATTCTSCSATPSCAASSSASSGRTSRWSPACASSPAPRIASPAPSSAASRWSSCS
jgi:hypothetical protein